jgi:hypothetical protein
MTSKSKRLPKINKLSGYGGGTCYTRDNGFVAFGDPFDLIYKREAIQEQQIEYRDLYRVTGVKKCRKKMLKKNEQLPYSS